MTVGPLRDKWNPYTLAELEIPITPIDKLFFMNDLFESSISPSDINKDSVIERAWRKISFIARVIKVITKNPRLVYPTNDNLSIIFVSLP